jgi:hypothetical protein
MNKSPIIPLHENKTSKLRQALRKKILKMIKIELAKDSDDCSSESAEEAVKDPYEIGALDSLLTEADGEN